ncbi:hypothetical protein ABZ605_27580 [Streptomyces sp. NPDC012765]|uniref:hypothetical protein n=1 Tax=Streptomyces sp. NPDC012765 TaxID=3155249 RepID=UPI0033C10DE4
MKTTTTLVFTDSVTAPTPYAAGVSEGRADAASTSPKVTAVRASWISEFADQEYSDGYRAGLTFDRDLDAVLRSRRGRP